MLAWACSRHSAPVPALTWNLNPTATPGYAGRAYKDKGRIMVVECPDHDFNAASLLHEAAHHISHCQGTGNGHSIAFYLLVWDLVAAASLPLDPIILAEVSYKATAWPALKAFGITPSPVLTEMALRAADLRTLRNAERDVNRLASRLNSRVSDTDPAYIAWRSALQRWSRLDRALAQS